MNPVRAFLAFSLAANTALGAFVLWRNQLKHAAAVESPSAGAHEATVAPRVRDAAHDSGADPRGSKTAPTPWQQLHGETDQDFVARLRAAGVPPETVRTIVRAEIIRRFAGRRREIELRRDLLPWWQDFRSLNRDPEIRKAEAELRREMDAAITAALGRPQSLYTEEDLARAVRRYGNLPVENIARLQDIERDYNELRSLIRTETNGIFLPEDRARLALLEAEKQRDLASLLTPAELADFERRSSPVAQRLQNQVRWLDATEAEYVALFEIWKRLENPTDIPELVTRELAEQRRAAEQELEPEIAAILGPTRFEEYKLAQHPAMGRVRTFTDGQQLPRETAFAAVKLQEEFIQRAAAVRSEGALTRERLGALEREAATALENLLGPEAFKRYRDDAAGRWMRQLSGLSNRPPR